jgi:hypothetical protein
MNAIANHCLPQNIVPKIKPFQPCPSCHGKGWLIVNTGNDQQSAYQIHRCGTCEQYENDLSAIEFLEKTHHSHHALLRLAHGIADLRHEGEPNNNGEAYEPTSEDAICTLNELIMEAREILGFSKDCELCARSVPYLLIDSEGNEIFRECFDDNQG